MLTVTVSPFCRQYLPTCCPHAVTYASRLLNLSPGRWRYFYAFFTSHKNGRNTRAQNSAQLCNIKSFQSLIICNSLPLSYLVAKRQLLFYRKLRTSDNGLLRALAFSLLNSTQV